MERTLLRDIRSVVVGTTSTLILPQQKGRRVVFVGSPPPPSTPTAPGNLVSRQASIAAAGDLYQTVTAAGTVTRITGWSYYSTSTTARLALAVSQVGVRINLDTTTTPGFRPINFTLNPGNAAIITVLTAGAAGEVADTSIVLETYTLGPRISLGFGSPAVLDQGLTIYAGQLPLILPGAAVDVDLYAVADAAGRPVNVVDLFYA